MDDLRLRRFGSQDLAQAHGLSSAVGWPHRQEDWAFAAALGHGVAVSRGTALLGTAFCWPFGPAHATLGLIIVAPESQGLGIGGRLMQALFAAAGERSLRLNATAAGLPLYARTGFLPCGQVVQYQGIVTVPLPPDTAPRDLRQAGPADLPRLLVLDQQASGLPRAALLQALIAAGETLVLDQNGEIGGFAIRRRFGRGTLIGPVVAADRMAARRLITQALRQTSGFVRLDVPDDPELGAWLLSLGLADAGSGIAMLRGAAPASPARPRMFGLASQAMG